ncbi:MAG: hypothetical protein E6H07_08545 [Bacteroidetes bacterium]|nr:MAG: hypothetical protein E6H07_08545 [Bacteroidota bacterium]
MAEIHVRAKKSSSSAWLWILISIIVVAVAAYLLIWYNRDNTQNNANSTQSPVSCIQYHSLPVAG